MFSIDNIIMRLEEMKQPCGPRDMSSLVNLMCTFKFENAQYDARFLTQTNLSANTTAKVVQVKINSAEKSIRYMTIIFLFRDVSRLC